MDAGKEQIRGKERVNLIERVHKDKPLVNMRLPAHDYEVLTVIDDIDTTKEGGLFAVDIPEDLREALIDMDCWSVAFEFMDGNKVPCTFTTSSASISGDKMWILFPDVIYREQKREHFRVEAPLEASLCFKKDEVQYRLNVSNISMGGLLITIRTAMGDTRLPRVGERLVDVEFVLAAGSVHIQEALVAWMDRGASLSTIQLGIQFIRLGRDERHLLREIVYELQREFLARRAGRA